MDDDFCLNIYNVNIFRLFCISVYILHFALVNFICELRVGFRQDNCNLFVVLAMEALTVLRIVDAIQSAIVIVEQSAFRSIQGSAEKLAAVATQER